MVTNGCINLVGLTGREGNLGAEKVYVFDVVAGGVGSRVCWSRFLLQVEIGVSCRSRGLCESVLLRRFW